MQPVAEPLKNGGFKLFLGLRAQSPSFLSNKVRYVACKQPTNVWERLMTKYVAPFIIALGLSSACDAEKTDSVSSDPSKTAHSTSGQKEEAAPAERAKAMERGTTKDETQVEEKTNESPPPAMSIKSKPVSKCDGSCPCVQGSKDTQDESWTRCTLSEAANVQGYPCAAGRLLFHKNGKIAECNLVKEARIGSFLCRPAPNRIKLHENGNIAACVLSETAEVDGFALKRYAGLELHDDGSIKSVFLKDGSREIDGYQCTKAIRTFKGRKLQSCTLTADATVAGQTIASGYQLILHSDGSLRGIRNWSGKVTYGGKSYDAQGRAGALLCFTDGKPDPASRACSYF